MVKQSPLDFTPFAKYGNIGNQQELIAGTRIGEDRVTEVDRIEL
ncbi:hypothetical protein ACYCS5_20460 [Paenibacillus sp. SEL3]|jgi:hypothetical protein|nr:hypothetical protein [Paenibacillus polymyxa]WRL61706.1 hypothetical protein U3G77_22490 [Paenibacillus polymyxa]